MRRSATRLLSLTFVPALIALLGFAASPAQAIEPQDMPATSAPETGSDQPHTKHGERKHAPGHHKHHHKHHHAASGGAKSDAK